MLEHAIPAPRDAPPAFTPRQRNGIRKIARGFGFEDDQRWDFVHEAWLKVHIRRFENDAMTGAVVFSSLPEWAGDEEDEQDDDDRSGTPEVERLTLEDRVLARQLWARAAERDREAADWLARTKVGDETVPEIAADVGQPAVRIYKLVSRLVDKLRPAPTPTAEGPAPPRHRRSRRLDRRRPHERPEDDRKAHGEHEREQQERGLVGGRGAPNPSGVKGLSEERRPP